MTRIDHGGRRPDGGPGSVPGPVADRDQPSAETGECVEEVARVLRSRGERMTRPRRAVVRALASRTGHVHAEEILTEVNRIDPSVHRASVYRTLETLCAVGVLQHVHLGHGATAYHLRLDGRDHLHAQCHRCTTVIDLPEELLDEVASWLSRHHGFTLDAGHVALSGTCTRCAGGGNGIH